MKLGNIQALYPKPRLSVGNKQHRKFPYLLKELSVEHVDQVWMVDITYLKLNGRFVYLVALIDVYSRYIVGWNLSFELDTENCFGALKMALGLGIPIIINSDQGCQFTSDIWGNELINFGIKISMDGRGRCKDNIYIERFWRSIKYEAIHLNEYKYFTELYDGVKEYIKFYNERRPHQSLHYKTPANIYLGMQKQLM
jgi:putative transposase